MQWLINSISRQSDQCCLKKMNIIYVCLYKRLNEIKLVLLNIHILVFSFVCNITFNKLYNSKYPLVTYLHCKLGERLVSSLVIMVSFIEIVLHLKPTNLCLTNYLGTCVPVAMSFVGPQNHTTYGSSNSNWYVKFQMFMSALAFWRLNYFCCFFLVLYFS